MAETYCLMMKHASEAMAFKNSGLTVISPSGAGHHYSNICRQQATYDIVSVRLLLTECNL